MINHVILLAPIQLLLNDVTTSELQLQLQLYHYILLY